MLRDFRLSWELISRRQSNPDQMRMPLPQVDADLLEARARRWAGSIGAEVTYFHMMGSRVVMRVRTYLPEEYLRTGFGKRFRGRFKNFKLLIEREEGYDDGFRALYAEVTEEALGEWRTQSRFLGA